MKRNIMIMVLGIAMPILAHAQDKNNIFSAATLQFKTTEKDFGNLVEGPTAEYDFDYVNTSSQPVSITNVATSCGCTTTNWTKEPIAPGQSGSIHVVYTTQNHVGVFTKQITVNTTTATTQLSIKGTVAKEEKLSLKQ